MNDRINLKVFICKKTDKKFYKRKVSPPASASGALFMIFHMFPWAWTISSSSPFLKRTGANV